MFSKNWLVKCVCSFQLNFSIHRPVSDRTHLYLWADELLRHPRRICIIDSFYMTIIHHLYRKINMATTKQSNSTLYDGCSTNNNKIFFQINAVVCFIEQQNKIECFNEIRILNKYNSLRLYFAVEGYTL